MVWTTRVSNPVCSPHFRASASITAQPTAFATGVLPDIYAFHRYTWNSIGLCCIQEKQFRKPLIRLSRTISLPTHSPAYTPFTPSKSGQRLHPPYYRGCWHGVSRCLLWGYRHRRQNRFIRPPLQGFTKQSSFIPHAALLRQAFAHCAIFLTAASHRSLGRISVPVWLIILSDQLPIVALVGRYPTN
jgi:hypothetical protein